MDWQGHLNVVDNVNNSFISISEYNINGLKFLLNYLPQQFCDNTVLWNIKKKY